MTVGCSLLSAVRQAVSWISVDDDDDDSSGDGGGGSKL